MKNIKTIEKLLKNYEYNKVRVEFLHSQREKFDKDDVNEYIKSKLLHGGYSGKIPKFILSRGQEIAKLNHVEETADSYQVNIEKEYREALNALECEISSLEYLNSIVEEALQLLKRVNEKFFMILQKRYIHNCTMENIAESMHLSRSRCYELRKAALESLGKIMFGEQSVLKFNAV